MDIIIELEMSPRKNKKFRMNFYKSDNLNKPFKYVDFGEKKSSVYWEHLDDYKKYNYISRHSKISSFDDPYSPATLSKYINWNKNTLYNSLIDYSNKFKFHIKL